MQLTHAAYSCLTCLQVGQTFEHPIPAAFVPAHAGQQVPPKALATYTTWELKILFAQQDHELLQTVREFHACKQEEGQSVSSYVLKMKSYIDNLEHLGHLMSLNLAVNLILVYLRKEYGNFVQNYNMHNMGKTINKLHVMLKLHEQTLPKKDAPALHAIRAGKAQKKNNKNKKPQLAAKGNNQGKREKTRSYLKELVLQGLRGSRKLKPEALSMYMAMDGIYEIDLSNSNTNESSMYVVSNKRAKLNLDSSLLWHCHLGHIIKKRIEKLQHDGLLNSIDIQSFEKCVSYHLKEHGIIAHRTPPYTPQHNGVSERRNRTLLDMVCSMMSQTTLPRSFWDYALVSVARILNMVPTNKVENTPCGVWYGQAPKLSYLKV
ncbi:zinc finger, CCHC-type containing protein [Tanacetum coccineum]